MKVEARMMQGHIRSPYTLPLNALYVTEAVCSAAKLSAARRMEAMKEAAEKGYEAEDYEQLEEELKMKN